MKDALIAAENDGIASVPICEIEGLLRGAHFIPETRNIDSLFKEMQSQKIHMVIVVEDVYKRQILIPVLSGSSYEGLRSEVSMIWSSL